MNFPQSNSWLNSQILGDGEYYVFSQQQGKQILLGYLFTTWCGSPYDRHIKFSPVELGKPLPLFKIGESSYDKGQLKTFYFDSSNLQLINGVYNRAMSWLNKMQHELKYPQLDESLGCIAVVIRVNQGVLSNLYRKGDFYKQCSLLEQVWGITAIQKNFRY